MWGNAWFSGLALGTSAAALIADAEGTICFANDAAFDLVGRSRPMVGAPIRSVLPAWDASIARGPEPLTVSVTVERSGGPPLPVELSMAKWRHRGEDLFGVVIRGIAMREHPALELRRQLDAANDALAGARVSCRRLEDVIERLPQAICVLDAEDRFVFWNRNYADLYPQIAPYLRPGIAFEEILRLSIPDGVGRAERFDDPDTWLRDRLAHFAQDSWREEQEWRDGRWFLHDNQRVPDGVVGMRIDITDLKRREASFRLLFQCNPVPMMLLEPGSLRLLDVNDAAVSLHGHGRERMLALALPDLHEADERALVREIFAQRTDAYQDRTIWHHLRADGSPIELLISLRPSLHEQRDCFLAALIDVSDRIRAERNITHIAHHDQLTGLANRVRFRHVAEAWLARRQEADGPRIAVHTIDLDGFKPVNDTHGHVVGDGLLRLVGERLKSVVRSADLVARIGGDEFAVIQVEGLDACEELAENLVACLAEPFAIGTLDVRIGASLGYAVAPCDGSDIDALMAAADAALYAAKSAGRRTWRAATTVGASIPAG